MKTIIKMIRHKQLVDKNFNKFIAKLQERRDIHDNSKFLDDEFNGFAELDSDEVFKKYGTEEYKKLIADNKGIKLHYERNSHHPEHYPNGVSDMSFLDIVEMILDWKSACETYNGNFDDSVKFSLERFKCNEQESWLIKMIAKEIA